MPISKLKFDAERGIYTLIDENAFNQAQILIGGSLLFQSAFTKGRNFAHVFSHLGNLFDSADVVVAPAIFDFSGFRMQGKAFERANEFLGQVFETGYTLLYSMQPKSVFRKLNIPSNGLFSYGEENEIFVAEMNNICFSLARDAGSNMDVAAALKECCERGSEYKVVLTGKYDKQRISELAEAGADCIVCSDPANLRSVSAIRRSDGKDTAVIESLGNSIGVGRGDRDSAFVRISLYRDADGAVIPEFHTVPTVFMLARDEAFRSVFPVDRYYFTGCKSLSYAGRVRDIAAALGPLAPLEKRANTYKNKTGFKPQFSIRQMCEILGVSADFPGAGTLNLDEPMQSFVVRDTELQKGCVGFIQAGEGAPKYAITVSSAKEKGAIMVVSETPETGLPCLVVPDAKAAYIKMAKAVRDKYDPFTVSITGTIGKSTTTDMIKTVMKYKYKTLDVRGNYNHWRGIGFCVQKLDNTFDAYVQETHGGSIGAAAEASYILSPDAAVITFVGAAHLSQVGSSVDDVLREKLRVAECLKPDGYLYVNNDNEHLRNAVMPTDRVVRCGMYNKDSDYYAEDIVDHGDWLEFTVVCKEGRYPAQLKIAGAYNIGNALLAFAVGRQAGIEPYKIVAALSTFRTSGYRQHALTRDGYHYFIDCDSTTPDSMHSSLKTLKAMQPDPGCKRVAILGNVAMLGKQSSYWHREFGDFAKDCDIDVMITLGGRAMLTSQTAAANGIEAYGFTERDEFEAKIREVIAPGDAVLFKASPKGGADLSPTVDAIVGNIDRL